MPSAYPESHHPLRVDLVHLLPEPPLPEPAPVRQSRRKQAKADKTARSVAAAAPHAPHKTIHLRPRTILLGGVGLFLLSTAYFGATAYLVYRDDLLSAAAAQQQAILDTQNVREARELEASAIYEGQIAALKDKIGSLTSEIDELNHARTQEQSTTDQKVRNLLDRQKELEARQKALNKLTEAARRAGIDVPAPGSTKARNGKNRSSKLDLDSTVTGSISPTVAKPVARFADMGLRARGKGQAAEIVPMPPDPRLAPIEKQIATMKADQDAVVMAMSGKITTRSRKIETVLKGLGQRVPKGRNQDVGGPFVPATAEDLDFKSEVASLTQEFDRFAKLRSIAQGLPLKRPIGNADISSRFGARKDPFLGRAAMHTGIDFRAPTGLPAKSVADGTVIAAGYNGGYGNMVDVDHGNGVVTRYGHLSKIAVKVGEKVVAGRRVGNVGSTGRSTGPHLHYEIRINGKAIDPMNYLRAGQEISAWL
ncbi:M23 family metallopeptidase [Kaistia adipata]|uniref:M23 family metallopeptidase n=1 Tax=Kaistia adipata TaxID=166954 RepID=UPI0012EB8C7F|nr:M23 family metallopeptidase [Kaistia adipata]